MSTKKQIKVTAWNLPGKYNLPFNFGQVVSEKELKADQMKVLIEAGDAKEWSKEIEKKEKEEAQKERVAELKAKKREELDELATTLKLDPSKFSNKETDLIPAIIEAETKE